jgi:hypothetical protein
MLVFKCEISIEAKKWSSEEEKMIYQGNVEDIVQRGLFKMTVPDWTVEVLDAEER